MKSYKIVIIEDEELIREELKTLLVNAGYKPPVIQIKSKDMGDYVTLSITDNGIGIKPSEVNRVFDKGFVGSNGRMRKKSTGIGLYLCDQLCLKLGIGIDIESEVGCYTTVLLHFPKSNHLNV